MAVLALAHLALLLPVWLPPPPGLPTALGTRREQVLVGTERGLYQEDPGGWSLVLTRGGVRDLAPQPAGTLIATATGLYEWPLAASAPRLLSLGAGARVRSVAVDSSGTAWAATEAGLFSRGPREPRFQRQRTIPTGTVVAVCTSGEQVWVATRGTLWVGRHEVGFTPRLRGLEPGWWELNGAVSVASSVWLSVPRGLWRVEEGTAEAVELNVGRVRGIALAREALWVASERGVYRFRPDRVSPTASSVELDGDALDLELASRGLLIATRRGIALLPLARSSAPGPALKRSRKAGPDVASVQRAVLAYLELSPARVARLDLRARRAALYPEVHATFSLDRDRTRERDHDQTFSSGDVRDLFDRQSEREKSVGLDVRLVWDLGGLAAPGHALSISRERRELIELRDQVLERVNRLYFDRLRVLAELDALAPDRPRERAKLELRARELSAHLDAWTGGMFSRLASGTPRR